MQIADTLYISAAPHGIIEVHGAPAGEHEHVFDPEAGNESSNVI